MEYLIRDFREDDIDMLVELCSKHAAFERIEYNRNGKHIRLKHALIHSQPQLFCWVVVARRHIVGYTTYTFDFSTWHAHRYLHLDCLYIEEGYRGFGIGENIIRRLQAVAHTHECVDIQWQTPSFNTRAIRFYNRIGAYSLDKKRFFLKADVLQSGTERDASERSIS